MHTQSTFKLHRAELQILWEAWVKNPALDSDPEAFYGLLKEIASYSGIRDYMASVDEATNFFTEVLCAETNSFAQLSIPGIQAIESFLVTINKQLGTLSEPERPMQCVYPILIGPERPQDNLDFKVRVKPEEIRGINLLWKVALEAKNDNVAVLAIEVLSKLHTKLDAYLEDKIAEISTRFIETAVEKLSVFYCSMAQGKENRSKEITKVMKLIEEMIDESERNGNAGFTPLYALHKYRNVKIKVINSSISYMANSDVGTQLEKTMSSSVTCWQLKMLAAQQFHIVPESVFFMPFHSGM